MNKCGFKPLESQAFWGSQVASGMLKAYGFGLTLQPRNVAPKLLAAAPLVLDSSFHREYGYIILIIIIIYHISIYIYISYYHIYISYYHIIIYILFHYIIIMIMIYTHYHYHDQHNHIDYYC
jgi:hypothetical protein